MHDTWKDMFVLGLPLAEKILRPIIVYAFLVISLRLSGKRELVQLNPFDLVVLLTLSNTVQNAIIGDDNSVSGGIIAATSLLVVNYLVVRFLYGHKRIDQLVEGSADVLIENGSVRLERLKKELISPTQPSGNLTFIGKKPATDDIRHQEVVERLKNLMEEVVRLRGGLPPANA